jgi:hypothetical protein
MSHTLDVSNSQEQQANEQAIETPVPENLVTFVTDKLAEGGHPNPEGWKRLLQPGVDTLPDPDYQAFAINRAWRTALGETIGKEILSAEESMDVRYALIDKCPIEEWKKAFTSGALPCILKHQLPLQK